MLSNKIQFNIQVNFKHTVHFTEGVFQPGNPLLRNVMMEGNFPGKRKAVVVVDESLAQANKSLRNQIIRYFQQHSNVLELAGSPVVVSGGESAKNTDSHVLNILDTIEKHSICRHSYVIAIGGGALLDMVGFAAATAHRGIRLIRIPTTTLSQNDSGVGIKNGINAFGKKNFIGTFSPPYAVINDFQFLLSLSPRDKRGGYAEAVKVALIRDEEFFQFLEKNADKLRNFEPEAMKDLIYRCAELHMQHIATSGDPFEIGSARPLDFGHWSAHKLEQLSNYRIRHGEAVAIGIAIDVLYSARIGLIDEPTANRVVRLLERLGFDVFSDELLEADKPGAELKLLKGLEEFREHLGGELTITLLKGIGQGIQVHEMDSAKVLSVIHHLHQRRLSSNSQA